MIGYQGYKIDDNHSWPSSKMQPAGTRRCVQSVHWLWSPAPPPHLVITGNLTHGLTQLYIVGLYNITSIKTVIYRKNPESISGLEPRRPISFHPFQVGEFGGNIIGKDTTLISPSAVISLHKADTRSISTYHDVGMTSMTRLL